MARDRDWFFFWPKIMWDVASMGWKVHLIEFNLKEFWASVWLRTQ